MNDAFVTFVPVMETHNAGDRILIRSLLDSGGIVYYIQNECVAPYLFNALPMWIMVREDQAQSAREILQDVDLSYSYGIRRWPPAEEA